MEYDVSNMIRPRVDVVDKLWISLMQYMKYYYFFGASTTYHSGTYPIHVSVSVLLSSQNVTKMKVKKLVFVCSRYIDYKR